MKKLGIGIILLGILITVFTGFNFVTRERVVDIGAVQITRDKNHWLQWSPLLGAGVIIVGAFVTLSSRKTW